MAMNYTVIYVFTKNDFFLHHHTFYSFATNKLFKNYPCLQIVHWNKVFYLEYLKRFPSCNKSQETLFVQILFNSKGFSFKVKQSLVHTHIK